jgi:hypothetical protein
LLFMVARIECDRGHKRVELFRAELLVRSLLCDGGWGGLRQYLGGDHRVEHEAARRDPHEKARCGKRQPAVRWPPHAAHVDHGNGSVSIAAAALQQGPLLHRFD